jgi:hypothetical protein
MCNGSNLEMYSWEEGKRNILKQLSGLKCTLTIFTTSAGFLALTKRREEKCVHSFLFDQSFEIIVADHKFIVE